MKIPFNLHSRSAQLLSAFLFVIALTSSHPRSNNGDHPNEALFQYSQDLDGTQLAQEAKDLLAETFHISAASVTAVYCCQLFDGRYKYNCTIPVNNTGFVYFTLSGGQIITDDLEGF